MNHKNYYNRNELINGSKYSLKIYYTEETPPTVTKILIASYLPNNVSVQILKSCIKSIKHQTNEPYELWVIDNKSPKENLNWLIKCNGINVILNRTEPLPPDYRKIPLWKRLRGRYTQEKWGSYANAVALEIGARIIDRDTQFVFTMHSDCLVLKSSWLNSFRKQITDEVRAVGYLHDNIRIKALHISGLLFDFQLFQKLGADFFPNFKPYPRNDLPEYDTGDLITLMFKKHGFFVTNFPNTYNTPDLEKKIPKDHPMSEMPATARSFDESGELFYAHLARGIGKSTGKYKNIDGGEKTYPEQWINFANKYFGSAERCKGEERG